MESVVALAVVLTAAVVAAVVAGVGMGQDQLESLRWWPLPTYVTHVLE